MLRTAKTRAEGLYLNTVRRIVRKTPSMYDTSSDVSQATFTESVDVQTLRTLLMMCAHAENCLSRTVFPLYSLS